MFARVAGFEGGDTNRIRELNQSGSAPPMPDSVKRTLVLADEAGGKRLFITFFDSRADLDAAAAQFESMGDEIPEEVRGRRTSVDVYEVVYEA